MTNHRHTPGATQDFLPLHPAHVVHVSVVFGETKNPKKGNPHGRCYILLIYICVCVTQKLRHRPVFS